MLDAVVEGLEGVFLESGHARKRGDHSLAGCIVIFAVNQAKHIPLDTRCVEGDHRVHTHVKDCLMRPLPSYLVIKS